MKKTLMSLALVATFATPLVFAIEASSEKQASTAFDFSKAVGAFGAACKACYDKFKMN